MDSGLGWLFPVGVAALVAAVLAGVLVTLSTRRARVRLEAQLTASREELAAVQQRLDGLARRLDPVPARREPQEFVITTAGLPEVHDDRTPDAPERQLTTREFASVALGESLVTLASLGYGVRRALSAENRNRIAFEMRREVRRARKQRKQDLKEAKRHLRAQAFVTDAAEDAA